MLFLLLIHPTIYPSTRSGLLAPAQNQTEAGGSRRRRRKERAGLEPAYIWTGAYKALIVPSDGKRLLKDGGGIEHKHLDSRLAQTDEKSFSCHC